MKDMLTNIEKYVNMNERYSEYGFIIKKHKRMTSCMFNRECHLDNLL